MYMCVYAYMYIYIYIYTHPCQGPDTREESSAEEGGPRQDSILPIKKQLLHRIDYTVMSS